MLEQQVTERAGGELVMQFRRELAGARQSGNAALNGGNTTGERLLLGVEMNIYSLIVLQASQG
ncbi:MAG TPA: hypothetical protein VGF91_08475 [Solirubrobacteraceae bacterium]